MRHRNINKNDVILLFQVAAQNCRKRKLDQIMHLAEEVKVIQNRKNGLVSQHEFLSGERLRVKQKFSVLYQHIFQVRSEHILVNNMLHSSG